MRLTPRSRTAHTLHLPDGIGTDQVMEVLRRYDPGAQRRRGRGRVTLAGHITVTVREGMLRLPPGHDVLPGPFATISAGAG